MTHTDQMRGFMAAIDADEAKKTINETTAPSTIIKEGLEDKLELMQITIERQLNAYKQFKTDPHNESYGVAMGIEQLETTLNQFIAEIKNSYRRMGI